MLHTLFRFRLVASLMGLAWLFAPAGQSGQSQEQTQSQAGAQPQSPPASESKPAGAPVTAPKADPEKPKKQKKVWTEDEMGKLNSKVSVVGGSSGAAQGSTNPGPKNANADSFRSRLAPLRQQLEDLDKEIQEMKTAKGSPRENIESQVQIRQARRAKIQEQIERIEEEARRQGIEPGQLR